jgi:membrane associated rhomboid family serine protease
MLLVYLAAALGGSVASFALNNGPLAVGASGAIFGLFGILFAASRMHLPMLDRRSRNILSQVGFLIVINIVFGFSQSDTIDNFAHLGGLATGLLLGVVFVPSGVQTLTNRWQPGADGRTVTRGFIGTPAAAILALGALAVGIAWGLVVGFQVWANVPQ